MKTLASLMAERRAAMAGRTPPRRGPRRLPRQAEPESQRLLYLRLLRPLLRDAHAILKAELRPVLEGMRAEDAQRADAPSPDGGFGRPGPTVEARAAVRRAAKQWLSEVPTPKLLRLAGVVAGKVSDFQRAQFRRVFKEGFSVDVLAAEPHLRPLVDAFTRDNVALIQSMASSYFEEVEAHLVQALTTGARAEQLAEVLQQRYSVSESKAALIANDQVGKLYGSLNKTRQEGLGITHYVWRTARDNRVRPEHVALSGKRIPWDKPPPEGHPGHAVNCRCYADPDVESVLDAL
ncbi:hypothetical protein D7Y27_36535 [Corallococcus sp. AB004]|nr:hypothetical protein D7Y27_36535 [Corallococcus sp. AB004]